MSSSTFTENVGSNTAAKIVHSTSSFINVTHSNFTGNAFLSHGKIISTNNAVGLISSCYFKSNSPGYTGQIIEAKSQSRLLIASSTFTENTVSSFGTMILIDSCRDHVRITRTIFTNNDAAVSRASIVGIRNVMGIISCCLF